MPAPIDPDEAYASCPYCKHQWRYHRDPEGCGCEGPAAKAGEPACGCRASAPAPPPPWKRNAK